MAEVQRPAPVRATPSGPDSYVVPKPVDSPYGIAPSLTMAATLASAVPVAVNGGYAFAYGDPAGRDKILEKAATVSPHACRIRRFRCGPNRADSESEARFHATHHP